MKTLFIPLLISVVVPGCIMGEPCVEHRLEVILSADATSGPAPLTVSFQAHGEGFYCGCCSGRDPTTIVRYDWDVDDDGVVDLEGPDLTECTLSFPDPGTVALRVTVTDDAGDTASDMLVLEVVEER